MTFADSAAPSPLLTSCPGPISTSAAHAEHCRACGRCDAITAALVQNGGWIEDDFEQEVRRPSPAAH